MSILLIGTSKIKNGKVYIKDFEMGIGPAGRQADKPQSASPFSFEDRVGGSMKEIQLTQGKVALVDDEDYERLSRFKWVAFKNGYVFYASRSLPRSERKSRTFYMHWEVIGKPVKGFETSHQDGNGLNNQRSNLQNGTKRQNQQNRIHGHKNSSRYPGVSWAKHRQKWSAQIQINGTRKHLGLFLEEIEAFRAYCWAVKDLGEEMPKGAIL